MAKFTVELAFLFSRVEQQVNRFIPYFLVYDVLTGLPAMVLTGHSECVRDVSWHPYSMDIIDSAVFILNALIITHCFLLTR